MKKLFTLAATAALGFGLLAVDTSPSEAQGRRVVRGTHGHYVAPRHHRSHTGRNVAIGVGAAIVGGIIANEAARSQGYGYNYGYSCGQLERRCDSGQDWACRQYDRRGC